MSRLVAAVAARAVGAAVLAIGAITAIGAAVHFILILQQII